MVSDYSPGPNVLHQVIVAAALYGHVARCGCGWKVVHATRTAAQASGRRHVWTAHGIALPTVFGHGNGDAA